MKIHALTLHVEDDGSTRQCKTYITWRENGVLRKAELIIEVQGDFVKASFWRGKGEAGVMGDFVKASFWRGKGEAGVMGDIAI